MTGGGADEYVYTDAHGQPLYLVRRSYVNGDKKFTQHRPDGRPGIEGIERVPYLLPAVLSACSVNCDVWIVEGEKDVHAGLAAGLATVTTSSGGSGSWRDHPGDDE